MAKKTYKQFVKIMKIWSKNPIHSTGVFIRHIDGDRTNNAVYNLAFIHAADVFSHVNDWVVDWGCDLTPKQIKFVKEHVEFLHDYLNRTDDENPYSNRSLKGKALITNPQMETEVVPLAETDKYKDFIAHATKV